MGRESAVGTGCGAGQQGIHKCDTSADGEGHGHDPEQMSL